MSDGVDLSPVVQAINGLAQAVNGLAQAISNGFEAQNATLQKCLVQLQGCNEALHGQWNCCLSGNDSNELLLEVSMLNYKAPPDERWKMYTDLKSQLDGGQE